MSGEPAGLLQLSRRSLGALIAIYVALAVAILAIPALVAQPRGASTHLTRQDARPSAAPGR